MLNETIGNDMKMPENRLSTRPLELFTSGYIKFSHEKTIRKMFGCAKLWISVNWSVINARRKEYYHKPYFAIEHCSHKSLYGLIIFTRVECKIHPIKCIKDTPTANKIHQEKSSEWLAKVAPKCLRIPQNKRKCAFS